MTREGDNRIELDALRARLAEANETLEAIRLGEVDAVIMQVGGSDQVYTLRTSDEPYRDLVEQMQEGAVFLAVSGDILYCNSRFAALVGTSLESVIGNPIDRFVHTSDREGVHSLLSARDGRRRSRLIGSDGRAIEVYLSLTTTVSSGVDRRNLIVTDLTEILEAHSSRERAERESRMKDEFLAMLAHELRNPLGAIGSAIQVLEARGGGEPDARARAVIARQVCHLSHLLDDLLDVQRVVSGKIQLSSRPLDMAETVRRAVGSFTCDAALDRRIDIATDPVVWVEGDAVRLEQVVTNLLANAVKYTTAGSVIRVSLRGDGGTALLTVEDAGIGISPELLPRIFDTFVQGDRTLDRASGGLGIGLTLVRRLVELHGGTIEASSSGEGQGSRFAVRMRQIAAPDGSAAISSAPDRREHRRVLLIEDNADAREMLRLLLEFSGHIVFDAPDGVRGLALFEAEHPDVAIIDIGLPGMDGHQVARRIRAQPAGRAVLLLALTGYGFPSDYQRSAESGFDHHLVKPVDPDELAHILGQDAGHVCTTS